MKSAAEIFQDVLLMQGEGAKPFRIVQRVLTDGGRGRVVLSGTLNNSHLTFSTGEEISFDGKAWRFESAEPEEEPGGEAGDAKPKRARAKRASS